MFVAVILVSGVQPPVHLQTKQAADTATTGYAWTQLTDDAGYAKSYNYQIFADDRYIRAFHHDGVWISEDGTRWCKTGLSDIINRQAFLDYVKFNGAIYALGTLDENIVGLYQQPRPNQ